ncbi:F-box/kelch-repeat protein At3g23880-like [Trifolium pratense]|uniref:F-box/kelch-repeat protein At3g23880-like n=1 Tax=Trifolium pratense TaxID=57577 RepID=UPI001E690B7E|nr:F-box/kelch-repeat protein At3g23880-like [Trifolium pratense]
MPSAIFPEEIIVEILLRLPVRSLLQFRCVCKFWKNLISDPQFAKSHVLSSTAYPQLVSIDIGIAKSDIVSYPLKPLLENPNPSAGVKSAFFLSRQRTSMIGSCNGLICFFNSLRSTFKLRNPAMKLKSKTSPKIFTCFDRMKILYSGFGYDQVNDRYRVLAVVESCRISEGVKTIIYTFGEKNWTTVQNFPSRRDPNLWWCGKFVSGTLNWIVNKGRRRNSTNRSVIVSFDLEKETYAEILLPQHDCENFCNPVLYVSSNNCICVSFDHPMKTHWVVWIMKEYGVVESWTKLMIIPQDMLISDFRNRCMSDALFITEHEVLLLRPNQYKLVVYKLNNNSGLDYRSEILGKFAHRLHIYHESLVSPQWLKRSQKRNKRKMKQELGSAKHYL